MLLVEISVAFCFEVRYPGGDDGTLQEVKGHDVVGLPANKPLEVNAATAARPRRSIYQAKSIQPVLPPLVRSTDYRRRTSMKEIA